MISVRLGEITKSKGLGKVQLQFLYALLEHGSWSDSGIRSGWCWDNHSRTKQLAETLTKKGFLIKTVSDHGLATYTPSGELIRDLGETS